jgi:DNA polymerase-3 subunit alpha
MNELEQYFIYKCYKGLENRNLANKNNYKERLEFEINTIIKMGYPGYFLIVQDFINWAKANDIYVGPGRGSAAGSLVAYALGITELDPIHWDLLFERFLNPARISMPDIDIDFEKRYRDRVIEYVANKYGQDKVAHIGTFGKMKAKSAVKHVTKTFEEPYATGEKLAKLMLDPVHGKAQSIAESIKRVEELYHFREEMGTEGKILKWAEKIEDIVSNAGVHASGIVIANHSLMDNVPLFLDKHGQPTTQWDMNNIEETGYIKFDFLGLDALSKIHIAVDLIKERHKIDIDINAIPQDDEKVFANLRTGDTVGVFQLEASSGIRDLLIRIRPNHIEDLVALVAIYRPGPLSSQYMSTYLGVRAGQQEPEYLVPELQSILEKTSGWLIYQEQVLEIAKRLAGYSLADADLLRRAIGKKKEKEMAKHENQFKEGWCKHGLPREEGNKMWDDIVAFADYAFNKSHAAAYAFITYQTAYLKTHYPVETMCAIMIAESGNQDDIIKCISECKRLGIKVLPPSINKSADSFVVNEDSEIRFGLSPIKGIGASAQTIQNERLKSGPFKSLRDFCERMDGDVNKGKLEALILAGTFDEFGGTRATKLAAMEKIWEYNKLIKAYHNKLKTYDKKLQSMRQRLIDIDNDVRQKSGARLQPLKTPSKPEKPQWPKVLDRDEMPKLDLFKAEHSLLGFFITGHPLDTFNQSWITRSMNTIEDIKHADNNTRITTAVVITQKKEITTRKKKQKMAFVRIEDLTGTIEAVIFPHIYSNYSHLLVEGIPIRIDGLINVTEADEGDRTTKILVQSVTMLEQKAETKSSHIDITVPALRTKHLSEILDKYTGNLHTVHVTVCFLDGTKIKLSTQPRIGNYKGAFEREIAAMINE